MNEENPEKEKQAKAFEFRKQTSESIQKLLQLGASLDQVAHMVGAENYLQHEPNRRGEPVLHFNVDAFTENQIEQGTYLRLPDQFINRDEVILPPDEGEISVGSGKGMKETKTISRSRFLVEALTQLEQRYSVVQGTNDPNMVRKLSYLGFYLPELKKLILVNDEESNATFIIHGIEDNPEQLAKIYSTTKEELKTSAEYKTDTLIYPGDPEQYKKRISEILLRPYEPKEKQKKKERVEKNKYEQAPEGWMTIHGIADQLGISDKLVETIVKKYHATNPEWFAGYESKIGRFYQHLHPDLVQIIRNEITIREKAPEGWMTGNGLSQELMVSRILTEKLAEKYKPTHPEWFADYQDKMNRINQHLHPDLVQRIRNEVIGMEKAPEGWMTKSGIADQLGVSNELVETIVYKFHATNPEWFADYRDKINLVREYLHPDLVQIIRNEITIREKAPEGWMTGNGLSRELMVHRIVIEKLAEKYKPTHPEWFADYINTRGKFSLHLHPDLVQIIRNEISGRKKH
ncbi:MAG: hypothetical protein ABI643_03160 [Candidatus Doudnabacteria bacterium]